MEKQLKDESVDTIEDTGAVYELSYLLLPSLAQEQVPAKAVALKEMLTSAGGQLISDENAVLIDLAYPMTKTVSTVRHKVTTGYFGWIKFEILKGGMEEVKKALDANDEILRYLIIKTVPENTLLNGKMKLAKEEKVRKDDGFEDEADEPAKATATVSEEIDKSIDSLVIA